MQPGATATDGTSVRVMKGAQVDGVTTVNDESFWRKDEKDIPADQVRSEMERITFFCVL